MVQWFALWPHTAVGIILCAHPSLCASTDCLPHTEATEVNWWLALTQYQQRLAPAPSSPQRINSMADVSIWIWTNQAVRSMFRIQYTTILHQNKGYNKHFWVQPFQWMQATLTVIDGQGTRYQTQTVQMKLRTEFAGEYDFVRRLLRRFIPPLREQQERLREINSNEGRSASWADEVYYYPPASAAVADDCGDTDEDKMTAHVNREPQEPLLPATFTGSLNVCHIQQYKCSCTHICQ